MIEPAQAIEQTGLSCAIGTNDRKNLIILDIEADFIERNHLAERQRDIFNL
jgi:hypothetical protein